jgi:hypothetical protein
MLLTSRPAGAAAGQWQAGGRVGFAWLDGPNSFGRNPVGPNSFASNLGPSAEAFVRRGLSDALDLDLQILTSVHPFQPDTKMPSSPSDGSSSLPWVLGFTPGLTYRWDVLRAIPYVGAGVGIYSGHEVSSGWNGTQLGAVARAGIEWLLNRDVVLSVQASAHLGLTHAPIPAPWVQLTAGAGYVWGW